MDVDGSYQLVFKRINRIIWGDFEQNPKQKAKSIEEKIQWHRSCNLMGESIIFKESNISRINQGIFDEQISEQ